MAPSDFGPFYRETDLSQLPVEAWSTYSNLIFLFLLLYWGYRIKGHLKEQKFIALCLPLLLVGFVGGTVYHATRSHAAWLIMDFMPILILCVSIAIYFWRKIQANWLIAILAVVVPFIAVRLLSVALSLPIDSRINIGYLGLSIPILLPIFWYLRCTAYRHGWWVVAAFASLLVAVFFRYADTKLNISFLPMGTHWLWHLFGGLSAHFITGFIFQINRSRDHHLLPSHPPA